MRIVETAGLSPVQKKEIIALWDQEYPAQLKFARAEAFDMYLQGINKPLHILCIDNEHKLLGWAVLFERDSETWFAVIVGHTKQKQGIGTRLLNVLKEKATPLNGWVIDHERYLKDDGTIYRSPMRFYLKNGFNVFKAKRLETEKLSAVKMSWIKDN